MGREHFLSREEKRARKEKHGQSKSHQRSLKQEQELADRGGGKLTVGSGNKLEKGDIKGFHGVFRVEAKTTKHKSFSVTREMVQKLEDAAIPNNELPAIIVEFHEDGTPVGELAVVPTYALRAIADANTRKE